jgi:hypothetical protein
MGPKFSEILTDGTENEDVAALLALLGGSGLGDGTWSGWGYAEGGCVYNWTEFCCATDDGEECCTWHVYVSPEIPEWGHVVYGDCY